MVGGDLLCFIEFVCDATYVLLGVCLLSLVFPMFFFSFLISFFLVY